MTEFKVPELGENVAGGDVMRVMVNVGDTVARDQPVLELETDKATIEVPSSVAGTVKEIRVKKGDKVKVGAVVLTVDAPASGNGDRAAAAKTPPPVQPPIRRAAARDRNAGACRERRLRKASGRGAACQARPRSQQSGLSRPPAKSTFRRHRQLDWTCSVAPPVKSIP